MQNSFIAVTITHTYSHKERRDVMDSMDVLALIFGILAIALTVFWFFPNQIIDYCDKKKKGGK